ncbi:transcription factor TFIIIB component B'' homolog isoform X2 [Cebidichthys violaceus]|uniref:transcription factor TFIIIB component B'' homolog isoform X2 n=1 Tax=Cebidichthys violaceus TaxID=271503 RepID=UPI0035C9B433
MFRRSRFSARPNVVKAAKTPQEAPSANQEATETPKDVGESSAAAVTDNRSVVTPSEKATAAGDGNDQNGEGTSSSAAVQRRKRFSIKPKVAPGRPAAVARKPKSPVKAVSETPIEVPVSDLDKSTASSQTGTTVAPQRLQSPRRRRPSEESKQPKMQPTSTLIPSDGSEPPADSATKLPADSGKGLESTSDSQVKGVPSRLPDKVPVSLPDKEAIALSEKAKTLVSSKSGLSISAPALSLSRLLNDPSDLQRIAKAQKLRDLLRQEMHKEKKLKKSKTRAKEFTLDPAKMTMRDLIRYLPQSNPMTSSVEESAQENETVIPPSPVKEACKPCKSPERVQEPVALPKLGSPREVEGGEEEGEEEEEEDDGMMVPQVKVAEDGSLIIDEESLTVEVLRAKGPNPANDRDPIFERGSTTTYSSFRKGTYTKPWSSEETDMFFLAISMVGTDFSMICQLFPLRARSEIKNKFKKEERENSWRVDKAFRERRKLDIEYFSKLLEKILEVQKTRKKLKSLAGKNPPKKTTRKAKGKKAARKLSVVEEEDEEEQKVIAASEEEEEEGEKENEDLCNEGGTDDAKPKKKRKRKSREDALTEEPNDKKNKTGEKSNEQDEAYIPGDTEAVLPEDCPTSDMSEKTESVNEAKDAKIKPAKLSRGRGPKPLLPLGRKWGKKPPPPSTKTNDTASDKGDQSVIDGGAEDQVNKDASPSSQADKKKSADDDSEEEDATDQPPRPTRYGRVPKPIKLLNYPAKEAASEATPASPEGSAASAARSKPKCTAKRGRSSKPQSSQESKKPKLVTLRASQSDYSDEEDEQRRDEEDVEEEEEELAVCSSSKDSSAPVFVPAGLRSPQPVISVVEETMEEDVIDFLTSDPTEVSEAESYNEAAQTLLTIGNLAPLPQSAQNQTAIQDHTTGTTLADVNETSPRLEEETASKAAVLEEDGVAPLMSATSDHGAKETSEAVTIVELLNSTTDNDDVSVIESSDRGTGSDMDPTPQLQSPESSKKNSPQTKKGSISKVKPKPNLGQASRTAQSKSQPGTSTVRRAEESHTVAPELTQTTETLSAAEETPEMADCGENVLKDDISYMEVRSAEEPSGRQERSVGEGQSHAATSGQSAPHVTPVEESPVSQREESEVGSTQLTRKSRFQKVKPKVNLAQTSRTVRSKPQTTKNTVEKDSITAPNPQIYEKSIAEVEAEPTCTKSPEEPSCCPDPASDLIPSLDLGTALTATEELSTTEERRADVGVVGQVESNAATSHQSASENQNLTEAQFEPSPEQATRATGSTSKFADKALMSNVGTAERSCNDLLTSDQAVTESQTEPGSSIHSAPVQESSDHPAPRVPPVEESPVSQREESEVGSTQLTRKSRFQKVKPKVNLAQTSRTVRSKPQTTKNTVEKDSITTPNPQIHEKTIAEVEAEPACTTSPEEPSCCPDPASDLIPLVDLGTALTATEELSTTEEKKTDAEVVGQVESDAVTSHQSASENQNLTEAQFTPRREQATRDTMPILESLDEKLMASFGGESSCNDPQLTSDSAVTESLGPGSNIHSAPVQESSDHPAPRVAPVEESPVSQREESEAASTCQFMSLRLQKVKPNLPQTSRTARSKPHTTKEPVAPVQHADPPSSQTSRPESTDDTTAMEEAQPTCSTTSPEKPSQIKSTSTASEPEPPMMELCSPHKTTEGLSSTEEQKTDAGRGLDSNSKGSEQNAPQRRPRFTKIKPSLGSSPRTTRTKLQSSDIGQPPEQFCTDASLTSQQQPVDHSDAQTEQDLTGTDGKHLTSTRCSLRTEPFSSTKLGPGESEKSLDAVEAVPTGSNTQPTDDPPLPAESTAEPRESSQQPLPENDCEAQSRAAAQQCSESDQTAAQNTDGNQSEATDSPSRKAPQTRRGRLIKPKPRLVRSSRPPQPRQVQNTEQAEREGEDASVRHKRVSELQPDPPDPAEGAIEQCGNQNSSAKDSGSSLDYLTQVPDSCTQEASNTGGTQNHPSLSVVPEMLSQQEPSDEPFFILSLTEIPVCPLSEAVDSVPELLPYRPVTDASIEQQSVPGESSAAAGEGPLSVPASSLEESGEAGLVGVQDTGPDPAACVTQQGWIMETPVEPHESATVHPSKLPETLENNEETEIPPIKPDGPMGTRRRGNVQVKPKTSKRKQASETLAAEHSELPGPSLQPQAFDDVTEPQKGSGGHADVEEETLTGGDHPEESSSGAPTTRTRVTRGRNRNPKGFPTIISETDDTAPASDPPPGKAASRGPKVRTPRAAGKPSTPAPAASTSCNVAPARSVTQPTEDTRSASFTTPPPQTEGDVERTSELSRRGVTTPDASLRPAEVSASQRSDSVESGSVEEEPTSVSQYFLCDIFTEVDEG